MDYLDFIEEVRGTQTYTLFEKVLIASKRAKDLSDGKTPIIENPSGHKHTSIALYELNKGKITPEIKEREDNRWNDMYDENEHDEEDDD